MSPIKGVTDLRRLPRVGKIHLGIKEKSQKSDTSYPKAVEWFEVHESPSTGPDAVAAFKEVYGDRPTELDIVFPSDDDLQFADANYKAYSQTHGLICKGDGEQADARWDIDFNEPNAARPTGITSGTWANRNTKRWERLTIPCLAEACPMQRLNPPRCKAVMNLQFFLPRVRGFGIWQIDTGSWHAIQNVRNNIELIKVATGGRIRGLELKLRRVSKEVTPDGMTKKKVYVLDIYTPISLYQLLDQAARLPAVGLMLLPSADEEAPEDLYPTLNGEVDEETGEVNDDGAAEPGIREPEPEELPFA